MVTLGTPVIMDTLGITNGQDTQAWGIHTIIITTTETRTCIHMCVETINGDQTPLLKHFFKAPQSTPSPMSASLSSLLSFPLFESISLILSFFLSLELSFPQSSFSSHSLFLSYCIHHHDTPTGGVALFLMF